ncbi:MAG: transglutaminase-like domain-containing protein, partial [Parafilimonas sp.]
HNFYCKDYPYTVEYEEDDDWDQMFYLPTWDPQVSALMSVQVSKLIVETPVDYKFRYKQFNLASSPQIVQKNDKIIYTWEVDNLATKQEEVFQPSWREIMPSVMLAPTDFEVGDYKGNMNTWKNYGDFVNVLKENKDVLPDDIKQKVHSLTDKVNDPTEKVDILYKYLQQNSRYISVQLGVGGWQPFDANYVATNKYGDCKALSNYMIALLKEAGIKADYVLIKAGQDEEPIQTDFPITQFNHATVCVPLGKDSVWLECTDQTKPAGYAGTFTGNRYALLMDDNGGHIVSTPSYTAKDNVISRKIEGTIDNTGNLIAKVYSHYAGCESDDLQLRLDEANKQQQEEILKEEFNIPTYDVTKYTYKQNKNIIPSIDEDLDITATNYASAMGKRFFLMPDVLTHQSEKIDTSEKRLYDIVLKDPFTHIDSISLKLSGNYDVESLPKDVQLNTKYGNYSISYKYADNTVYCVRKFMQNDARFPASDFTAFATFINTIYKADRNKIVFLKKDS